jgi:hypothetical protein
MAPLVATKVKIRQAKLFETYGRTIYRYEVPKVSRIKQEFNDKDARRGGSGLAGHRLGKGKHGMGTAMAACSPAGDLRRRWWAISPAMI